MFENNFFLNTQDSTKIVSYPNSFNLRINKEFYQNNQTELYKNKL